MKVHHWTALLVTVLLAGCNESAERFFSGRPSGMSMVHNRIIAGGPPEAVFDLLRVPGRFPDATPAHIAHWQGSVVAWWHVPEKKQQMRALFGQLTPADRDALRRWVRTRGPNPTPASLQTLAEIASALEHP